MSRNFLVPVLLPADPANPLEAATKQYVDSSITGIKIASGLVSVSYTALNTASSGAVTFPVGRFTAVPQVVATIQSNAPLQFTPAFVGPGITTSGCTIYLAKIAGATTGTATVAWIAVQ